MAMFTYITFWPVKAPSPTNLPVCFEIESEFFLCYKTFGTAILPSILWVET
jgi:hypothetical protein